MLGCSQELARGKTSLPSFFCARSTHARSWVLGTRGTFVPRPAGFDGDPTGRLNVSLNLKMEMVWKRVNHGVKKLAVLSLALCGEETCWLADLVSWPHCEVFWRAVKFSVHSALAPVVELSASSRAGRMAFGSCHLATSRLLHGLTRHHHLVIGLST